MARERSVELECEVCGEPVDVDLEWDSDEGMYEEPGAACCEEHARWDEDEWQGMPCWSDGEHFYALETLVQLDDDEEPEDDEAPVTPAVEPDAPIDMVDFASRLLGFGPVGGAR